MIHWGSVLVGAALVAFLLAVVPAPESCGCAGRKRRLRELGGRVFGA